MTLWDRGRAGGSARPGHLPFAVSLARALALALAVALAVAPSSARAQGNCDLGGQATCVVGGTNQYAMTVTISTVVRLSIPSTTVALGTATGTEFANGFGTPVLVPVSLRANRSWTLALRTTAATWTATGTGARANKPNSDLQWGTATAGPFTNLSTTNATVATGAATGTGAVNLYLRSRYQWTLDTPGSYSIPLQLTITAP